MFNQFFQDAGTRLEEMWGDKGLLRKLEEP